MYTAAIADDEKLICNAIQSVIDTALPELEILKIFHDGLEAYDYLASNHADFLILDIQMPKKSGLDIAQLVREQNTDSYIIIITAHQDFQYAKRAIDHSVNAFLTKPFTSGQLVDALKKGITYLNQKNAILADRQHTHRHLLQALCFDNAKTPYPRIRLCNDSFWLEELLCTEVTVKDDSLCSLPRDTMTILKQTLLRIAEKESELQCSFLLECNDTCVKILVFSKNEPDLNFLSATVKAISFHSNNVPQYRTNTYSSFAEYRSILSYTKEMEHFFQLAADSSALQAKKYLSRYIQNLSSEELVNFYKFLKDSYHIVLESSDADSIIQSLDTLIRQSLSTQSGNFVVNSACEYIRNNYSSGSLSLESTATALSVSSVYLSRAFKKYTNQNFSEYLLNVRMEQAKRLLQSTYMPTTEIAAAIGYDNTAYFRASFKSYFSMTPKQYRQLAGRKDGKDS